LGFKIKRWILSPLVRLLKNIDERFLRDIDKVLAVRTV
jgi:hypothetical protein